jgi:DnaA family protein
MNQQLALAIQLNDDRTLDDFYWSNNLLLQQHLLNLLQTQNSHHLLYLWGIAGSGKSHLLQACCQALPHSETIYLPLQTLREFDPQILEGLETTPLICIDDIDAIVGLAHWEEALFHLYNRIRDDEKGKLLVSASAPPTQIPFKLADLQSRLSWGLVLQLNELEDEEKIKTLQARALKRGFELPTSVVQFLIHRCARNMHDLEKLLNELDKTSLAAQRKITIPFVKQALGL